MNLIEELREEAVHSSYRIGDLLLDAASTIHVLDKALSMVEKELSDEVTKEQRETMLNIIKTARREAV